MYTFGVLYIITIIYKDVPDLRSSYGDENHRLIPGCKYVYFCCKVGHFNKVARGGRLAFGAHWSVEEMQLNLLPGLRQTGKVDVVPWFLLH